MFVEEGSYRPQACQFHKTRLKPCIYLLISILLHPFTTLHKVIVKCILRSLSDRMSKWKCNWTIVGGNITKMKIDTRLSLWILLLREGWPFLHFCEQCLHYTRWDYAFLPLLFTIWFHVKWYIWMWRSQREGLCWLLFPTPYNYLQGDGKPGITTPSPVCF